MIESNYSKQDAIDYQFTSENDKLDRFFSRYEKYIWSSLSGISRKDIQSANTLINESFDIREAFSSKPEFKSAIDAEILKTRLINRYKLKDWQCEVDGPDELDFKVPFIKMEFEDYKFFRVHLPEIEYNVEIITGYMEQNGYHLIRKIKGTLSGYWMIVLIYAPVKQNRCDEELRREHMFLYHVTPTCNEDSILDDGFIPHARNSKNSDIYYIERTYFFTEDTLQSAYDYMNEMVSGGVKRITLLVLELKLIRDNIPFYYDPLLGKKAVYTTVFVSSDAVVDVKQYGK
jgi:hypothetical protein